MVKIYLEQSLISCLLAHSHLSCSCHSLGGSLASGGSSESSLEPVELRSHATTRNSDSSVAVVFGVGWTSVEHEFVESL